MERHPVLRYGDNPDVLGSIGSETEFVDMVFGFLNTFTYLVVWKFSSTVLKELPSHLP